MRTPDSVIRLATEIRRASESWELAVEDAIFDTIDPEEVARFIVDFVARRIGSVEEAVFYRPGVGVVVVCAWSVVPRW